MSAAQVFGIAINELRLRLRRIGTVVALLSAMIITWAMVPDINSGMTLLAVNEARTIYNSQCLAIGGSTLMSMLLSLAGFYLVRGRTRSDLTFGVGAAISASQISNAKFLVGRWLGNAGYLVVIGLTGMASLVVLHQVRGEGPIELYVYLKNFLLILLPEVCFIASIVVMFEAWSPTIGKAGDILYFVLWLVMMGASGVIGSHATAIWPLGLALDFSGLGTVVYGLGQLLGTTRFSLGVASFNAALTPAEISTGFWSTPMVLLRWTCVAVALLPMLPAVAVFHRFSPDRISPKLARGRRSQLGAVNDLLFPIGALVRPMYGIAMHLPGSIGLVVADIALQCSANPLAILASALLIIAGVAVPPHALAGLTVIAVVLWGIVISDYGLRDYHADLEQMTAYLPGGPLRRYLRQLVGCFLLGMGMVLPIVVRLLTSQNWRSMALTTGLFTLSAISVLLARVTRTSRAFIALFLFWVYIATQLTRVPALDWVGFNGSANAGSVSGVVMIGTMAVLAGLSLTVASFGGRR